MIAFTICYFGLIVIIAFTPMVFHALIGQVMLSLKFITDTFYSDWKRVRAINCGECYSWAYLAHRVLQHRGIQSELWCSEDHAFLKIGNKFYDAERPLGVLDYDRLPCNRATGSHYAECLDMDEWKEVWNIDTRFNHWITLDAKVAEYMRERNRAEDSVCRESCCGY